MGYLEIARARIGSSARWRGSAAALRDAPLFTDPLRLEEGCVVLSEKPGIGLDLDRKTLDRFKT